MNHRDQTEIGGNDLAFADTQWTQLGDLQSADEVLRRRIVGDIMARYWKPVYSYLRQKGMSNDDAKDTTQAYFHDVILKDDLLSRADRTKGRFRTYLLTTLSNYTVDQYRAATARKRAPDRLMSLDAKDYQIPASAGGASPEDAFIYTWAADILDQVLAAVARDCLDSGQEQHWRVFEYLVVRPTLEGIKPRPLDDIAKSLGIRDSTAASNMCITVKRKFKAALWSHVRLSVDSDDQVDEEIRELMRIVSGIGAG